MTQPKSILRLDDQFNTTLNELESSGDHYFITGRAGTGKSTLIRLWKRSSHKKMVVLAPTGIAALQVGGQTIHSFLRFPPRMMESGDFKKLKNRKLIQSLDAIIIDEISMVRADMLDNIDRALQLNRGNNEPFGGLQMVFFGDLFQLPPIISDQVEREYMDDQYDSPYFFSAHVWQEFTELRGIELTKIYRQEEKHFLRLLEEIRHNTADWDTMEAMNQRYQPGQPPPPQSVTICTRRYLARSINLKRLNELQGITRIFQATVTGNFSRSTSPAPPELMLREGAQVMFVCNDPMKRYVNGSLGKVARISDNSIVVKLINGVQTNVEVEKYTWDHIRYSLNEKGQITTEVTGTFEQYPLNLAWAMTIHKSQGMTFDQVIIDMGSGAFDFGQAYVALSRCTHLKGVHLKKPLRPEDIQTDERIVQYYRKMF